MATTVLVAVICDHRAGPHEPSPHMRRSVLQPPGLSWRPPVPDVHSCREQHPPSLLLFLSCSLCDSVTAPGPEMRQGRGALGPVLSSSAPSSQPKPAGDNHGRKYKPEDLPLSV